MIPNLKTWWDHPEIAVEPPNFTGEAIRDFALSLPSERQLDEHSVKWLDIDVNDGNTLFNTMARRRAYGVQGPSKESHQNRRQRLTDLISECESIGYRLPAEFTSFLADDNSVSRMRFACHWFQLPDFTCQCPLDTEFVMILFLCEEQGCNYTHLLIDRNGDHCVTRTCHWYGMNSLPPEADSTDDEKQIYLYSNSFAEFICIASEEIREFETRTAKSKLDMAGKLEQIFDNETKINMCRLALSYDPESTAARLRLSEFENAE